MINVTNSFKSGDQLEPIDPEHFGVNSWIRMHQNKLIVHHVFISLSGEPCIVFQGRPGTGYYAHRFRHKLSFIND